MKRDFYDVRREFDIIADPKKAERLDTPIENRDSIQRTTPPKRRTEPSEDNETNRVTLAPGDYLVGTLFKAPVPEDEPYFGFDFRRKTWIKWYKKLQSLAEVKLPEIRLSSRDVTRWKMAWRAIQAFTLSKHPLLAYGSIGPDAITLRCKDWPEMDFDQFSVALGFSAAAFIYGSLHALAWFAHFDSLTEQFLWRISACLVMGGIPVFLVLGGVFLKSDDYVSSFEHSWMRILIDNMLVGSVWVVSSASVHDS